MKHLKLLDNWRDRYDFLESAPPPYFVLATTDGSHILYKGLNDKVVIENGVTYNFIHAASNIEEQEAIIEFDSPLPQNINVRVEWTVTVASTGAVLTFATIVPCAKGAHGANVQAPTTINYKGVECDVSNIENFVIKGHTYTYDGQIISMTATVKTV